MNNIWVRARQAAYALALKGMFTIDPEKIHDIIMAAVKLTQKVTPLRKTLGAILPVNDPILVQDVFGIRFNQPLGLAAGFDKNAEAPDVWAAVGFGYAELGTVTAKAQPGNDSPRLFRLPADKAILNRMGFNNEGAETAARNLRARHDEGVIAINIGKTKVVAPEDAVADYRASARAVNGTADFVVVNVSSPNTPGLRDLQAVESLRPILEAVIEETSSAKMPVLVKIAPDLNNDDVDAVADLAVKLGLAGIVATNTTISREGLSTDADKVASMGAGGISGAPLNDRALEVLQRLYARVGGKLALVSSGGISTPQQAWERITSGANLLQGYTGMIYYGPDWIRLIHKGLATQCRRHGLQSLHDAVGSGLPWKE